MSPSPGGGCCSYGSLGLARHKREWLNHIFVCPRLLTSQWRKKLYKHAGIILEIPAGARPYWPASMFEPLILGLTLHFVL